MAHAFSITDGTTTFSLTTTNSQLINYPMAPAANERGVLQHVTESIDILLYAATPTLMQTAAATLERLLQKARERTSGNTGPVIYIQAQLDSDSTAWRSRIYDARLELKENSLAIWGNAKMEATVYVERAPYWEGALTQIPLTNGNGTSNTSGLKVYNCGDSTGTSPNKRDNYLQIAAGDVTGSLPAPVRLELTNTSGSSIQYTDIFLAVNSFSDPANFAHILEAETAGVNGTYDVDTVDTNCSGGSKVVSSSGTLQANISTTLLSKAAGYDFHILQRVSYFPATTYVRPSVYDPAGVFEIRRGEETPLTVGSQTLHDLGVISLPPGGYSTAYGALRILFACRLPAATSIEHDYWALFPTTGFRRLQALVSIANAATIIDDPIEDRAYALISGAELPYIVRKVGPVVVQPNTLQRIYVLWADLITHDSVITQTMTVKAYYRPRRSTIG